MPTDRRKFKGSTPVTSLNTLKDNIHTHTSSDRINEYREAWRLLWVFHAKWNELRRLDDKTRANNYEARVYERIGSVRDARDRLIQLGIDYKHCM